MVGWEDINNQHFIPANYDFITIITFQPEIKQITYMNTEYLLDLQFFGNYFKYL